MFEIKFICCGAAGNKAAIDALENGILSPGDFLLVNSTNKDIPEKYREYALIYKNADGAGRERELGKKFALNALKSSDIDFGKFITNNTKIVVLVASLDGGTGSSSITVLARYIHEVLGKHVYIIGFNGFENDARSLSNSIECIKELKEDYTISIISNKKCLEDGSVNHRLAEKKANEIFSNYVKTIKAIGIQDSEINIDGAELYKTISTPGYLVIETGSIEGVKNVNDFNKVVKSLADESKSIETEPSAKRMCMFVLSKEKLRDNIDFSFTEAKKNWGSPFELYQHIQNDDSNTISIISAGLKLPIEYFENVYNRYKEESSKVNKGSDDFFSQMNNLIGDDSDSEFNSLGNINKTKSAADFFNDFESDINNNSQTLGDF